MSNKKLDDTNKSPAAVLGYSKELGARMAEVIALIGTQKEAARIAGVTDEQLGRWKLGKSKANFIGVAALTRAAGVDLNWLATGEGDMMLGSCERAGLSRECLAAALRGAEATAHAQGDCMNFDERLDLILSIYDSITRDR